MKKIETLEISAKRWFQKSYGNTYHVVKAVVNEKEVVIQNSSLDALDLILPLVQHATVLLFGTPSKAQS